MMALASPCPSPEGSTEPQPLPAIRRAAALLAGSEQNAGPAGGERAGDLARNEHPFGTFVHGCQMKIGGAEAFGEPPSRLPWQKAKVRQGAIRYFPPDAIKPTPLPDQEEHDLRRLPSKRRRCIDHCFEGMGKAEIA